MSWIVRKYANFSVPHRITLRTSHSVSPLKTLVPARRFSLPSPEKSFVEELRLPPIFRPILFTVGISGGAYGLAAYWTNRDTEKWMNELLRSRTWVHLYGPPTSDDLRRARHHQLFLTLKNNLEKGKAFLGESPSQVAKLALYTYTMCAQKWINATEGRRVCRIIIALNAAIWFAWQIPRFRPLMNRHFLHYPLSGLSHTLLTSVFSHKSILHLLFNGIALSGFGTTAALYLATQQSRSLPRLPESTSQYHFVSFFVTAGLFSSLLSHAVRVRFYFPQLLSKLSAQGTVTTTTGATVASTTARQAASARVILPSLGASGAIWACVSLSALAYPEARLSLILPTPFSVPIQAGTAGLVAIDVLGIIRGWRFFDHWAHLGGALFGAFYYAYGPRFWDAVRLYAVPPKYDS